MGAYYQIERGDAPWGDYGETLWNGRVTEEAHDQARSTITVSRTGPFVPPITHPFGRVIVTDAFRASIIDAGFTGLTFEPAEYGKVVRIDWHEWDWNAEDPLFYPGTGEPEDYLNAGVHAPDLVATMPKLWAWKVIPTPGLQINGTNTFRRELHPGSDVAGEFFIFWINERMKIWLGENAGNWLSFAPVIPR